jgi:ATP-dependent protease ClpP protease subunit
MEFLRDREALSRLANKATQSRSNWYEIKAKSDDEAEIFIYSEIGWMGASSEEFIGELKDITTPRVSVRINSMGGSVFEAVAIYNALREHPSFITTRVDAVAASAASVIAQAGDHRVMLDASEMMIHEAHGVALGATASDMRELADLLDRQNDKIAAIYARAAGDGRKKSHFQALMSAGESNMGTWMTPEEAVTEGLADEVVKPSAKEPPAPTVEPEPEASTTTDFSSLFVDDPDDFEWVTN